MGLTKYQIMMKRLEDGRKTKEYYERMRPVWAEQAHTRNERLATVGMLLDAAWVPEIELFVKISRHEHAKGLVSHWETFYNEVGEECPRPKGYKSA